MVANGPPLEELPPLEDPPPLEEPPPDEEELATSHPLPPCVAPVSALHWYAWPLTQALSLHFSVLETPLYETSQVQLVASLVDPTEVLEAPEPPSSELEQATPLAAKNTIVAEYKEMVFIGVSVSHGHGGTRRKNRRVPMTRKAAARPFETSGPR